MVRMVSGNKYWTAELCIMIVGGESEGLSDILGALLEGRRGVIMIGDVHQLLKKTEWASFLGWCQSHNLIMTSLSMNDRTKYQ